MDFSWDDVADDVTPTELYNIGFDAGIHWAFHFLRHSIEATMSDDELKKLASWFELKLPYKDRDGWYSLMRDAIK